MQSNPNELATKATTRSAAAATSKEPNANPTPPSPPNQTISTPKTNKQTTPLPPSPKAHSVAQPTVLPPSPRINHIPTSVILSPPTQDIQEIDSSSSEEEEVGSELSQNSNRGQQNEDTNDFFSTFKGMSAFGGTIGNLSSMFGGSNKHSSLSRNTVQFT